MIRSLTFLIAGVLSLMATAQPQPGQTAATPASAPAQNWIAISNGYAKLLTDVAFQHSPEGGSRQGLTQYDTKISQPTLADEDLERQQNEAVLEKLQQEMIDIQIGLGYNNFWISGKEVSA